SWRASSRTAATVPSSSCPSSPARAAPGGTPLAWCCPRGSSKTTSRPSRRQHSPRASRQPPNSFLVRRDVGHAAAQEDPRIYIGLMTDIPHEDIFIEG